METNEMETNEMDRNEMEELANDAVRDQQVPLPPAPGADLEPEVKKPSRVKMVVAAFGVGVALVAVGAVIGGGDSSSAAAADPGSAPAVVTSEAACLDGDVAVQHSTAASGYMQDAMAATEALDIEGAADAADDAGTELGLAAAATTADPAVSDPMVQASEAYHSAADHLRSFDIEGATEEVGQATAYIEQSTDAVSLTTVPSC